MQAPEVAERPPLRIGRAAGVEASLGADPCLPAEEGARPAGGEIVFRVLVQGEDVVEQDMSSVGQGALGGGLPRREDRVVPAPDRLRVAAHRLPFDLVEVRPQVVPLDPVDPEIDGQAHDVGQFGDVRFEERELERDAAPVAAARRVRVPNRDEGPDVGQDLLPARAEHDGFLGFLRGAVPGDLHVGGDRDDPLRPCLRSMLREGAVGGQVEPHAVLRAERQDILEVLVEQRLAHRGGDDLPEPAGRRRVRDHPADEVDGHPPAGPPLPPARGLPRTVGRVLLAHDAAHVAGVRIRIEGDPPRTLAGPHPCAVAPLQHPPVETFDRAGVVFDRRDVTAVAECVAPPAETPGEAGVVDEPLHPASEGSMRPVLEQQAVDLVADVFGHAARAGRDHRHPRLLRLVDDERRVLDPHRGDDDGVHPVEHVPHDVLVAILREPLHAGCLPVRKAPGERLQGFRVLASRASPDAQHRLPVHPAEGPDQVVDPLRGDVGADVAEGERLPRRALPAAQPREVEAVVEADQLALRDPELVAIPVAEVS